jgi:HEAT repeat protein
MRRFLTLTLLLLAVPAFAQDDESDKTVFGKRASEWTKILRESNEVLQRRRALLALESAGPQTRKVFEEVGSALRLDKEEIVRQQAAGVLGRLGAKAQDRDRPMKIPVNAAVEALASSLSKERAVAVREAVATALGRIGPESKPALPMLGNALKDESVDVRSATAEALARIGSGSKEVIKPIIDALRENKGKDGVRVRAGLLGAVQAIGRPEGLSAVTVLIEILREPEPPAASLDERRKWAEVQRQIIETLGVLGDTAALDVLSKAFEDAMKTRDIDMARSAINALTKLGGDRRALVKVLLGAVIPPADQLQDRFVRCQAIHTLGQLGKELGDNRMTTVDKLALCLADKLSEVKLSAALALGELGPEVVGDRAEKIIKDLQVLKKAPEKQIAEAAADTIARLEPKSKP